MRLANVVIDGEFQGAECSSDLKIGGWMVSGQERPQEPVVDLGVADREALTVAGQDVGVAVFEPQTSGSSS